MPLQIICLKISEALPFDYSVNELRTVVKNCCVDLNWNVKNWNVKNWNG